MRRSLQTAPIRLRSELDLAPFSKTAHHPVMITMHGLFDLKSGCREDRFAAAYRRFAIHLVEAKLIVSWRMMRRRPDPNYDSSPPATGFHVTIDFADYAQAEACWEHIEHNREASHLLHRGVYAQIENYRFYLSEDID